MQKRSVTTTVLIVLLTGTLGTAYLFWTFQRYAADLVDSEYNLSVHLDALTDTAAAIGTAQQGYVAPGQLDEPLFEQTSTQLSRLSEQVSALASTVRSPDATTRLEALSQGVESLTAADARARENLGRGQDLMASDVIYSDGRNVLDAMTAAARTLQAAEHAWYGAEHAASARSSWSVLGVLALLWAGAGAFLMRGARRAPAAVTSPEAGEVKAAAPMIDDRLVLATVDMGAVAALCTDLSRVSDMKALAALLNRSAALLHASGVMLWMGAGDQLFAALAHGYPAETVSRLPPIARDADNAAAEAWRTGHGILIARSETAGAAVVAPLFSPGACIGVLAVEMTQGRQVDGDIEAAVALIAAQVATAVSAWPAASAPRSSVPAQAARTA